MTGPYREVTAIVPPPRQGWFRRLLCRLGLHHWRAYPGVSIGFMAYTVRYDACSCRHVTRRRAFSPSTQTVDVQHFRWTPDPWECIETQFEQGVATGHAEDEDEDDSGDYLQ